MRLLTPESHQSTLGLDASEAGVIQIFDTTLLRSEKPFSDLVGEHSPSSEARQIGDSAVYEVWPRIGATALEKIIELTGSQVDTSRLQPDHPDFSAQKPEAFPGLLLADTHAIAA